MVWRACLAILAGVSMARAADAPQAGDAENQEGLRVGAKAPEVSATDEEGRTVQFSSFKDKSGVVLFFFPKAFTPGCTAESCGFRDENSKYLEHGYVLFGASRDTPEQLKKFKEKYELPYSLLSDPDGKLALAFGIPPGARQTVVIAKDGTVEKLITSVAAKTHPLDLLTEVAPAKK
jgi:peroxiredoxin Q/BCP